MCNVIGIRTAPFATTPIGIRIPTLEKRSLCLIFCRELSTCMLESYFRLFFFCIEFELYDKIDHKMTMEPCGCHEEKSLWKSECGNFYVWSIYSAHCSDSNNDMRGAAQETHISDNLERHVVTDFLVYSIRSHNTGRRNNRYRNTPSCR